MRTLVRRAVFRLHRFRVTGALVGASCVREWRRFLRNELRDARSVERYHLRESGLALHVRHPLLDMWAVEEMFWFHAYALPQRAMRVLSGLGRPVRILDLGGHIGCFGLYMLARFPGASIVSFEPDPGNVEQLRATVEANGLEDRWRVIEACAATGPGSVDFDSSFHLSRAVAPGESSGAVQERTGELLPYLKGTALLEPRRVRVETEDALPFMADADLVKIDIEGGEWEILDDPRLGELEAPVLVLEYHATESPGEDGAAIVRRALAGAGYELGPGSESAGAALRWAFKA